MLQPPDRCGAGITPPGGPQLATLGLTGLTLDPEFDPDVHVYAVTTGNESDDISLKYEDTSVGCMGAIVPGEYADYASMTAEEFMAATQDTMTMVEMRHSSETGECEGTATWPETDCCLVLLPIYGETPAPSMNMDEWTWIDVTVT